MSDRDMKFYILIAVSMMTNYIVSKYQTTHIIFPNQTLAVVGVIKQITNGTVLYVPVYQETKK